MTFARDLAAAQAAREQQHDEEYLQFSTGEMFDLTIDGRYFKAAAEQLIARWQLTRVTVEEIATLIAQRLETEILADLQNPHDRLARKFSLEKAVSAMEVERCA